MKLSLDRKWGGGYVHVRAGAIVTVAHDHQVTTASYDPRAHGGDHPTSPTSTRRKFSPDEKWKTAKVGDLAFELVAVATGKTFGHSYLSGDAVGLNRYDPRDGAPAPSHWYTPTIGWRVTFPTYAESAKNPLPDRIQYAAIMRCKYAPPGVRVITFDLEFPRQHDDPTGRFMMERAAEWTADAYTISPDPTGEHSDPSKIPNDRMVREVLRHRLPDRGPFDPELARASGHVFGFLRTSKRKGVNITLHLQPAKDADDYGATAFQIGALTWCRPTPPSLIPVDIFDQAAYERACGVPAGSDCPHGWIKTTCTACRREQTQEAPAVAS